MAADALPDFSTIFMSDKFSDASLILVEEGPAAQTGAKRGREQQEELPAHGVVLLGTSGYCKAKIENWETHTGTRASKKLSIKMPVPRGQLDMGRLLVKGMYYPKLDLAGISQQQQLQLLLLADRYEVPKVLAAAASTLEAVPLSELEWQMVMQVFELPAGCQDSPACSSVFRAAAAKLQQQLGDLELAHNDPAAGAKQRQLLELPHAALKQLLADPATKVSSENTVFYTIQAWYVHQVGNQGCAVSAEQVQELVQLVRMRHCSQLYVATVIAPSALASSFGPAELALATAISGAGASGISSAWQAAKDAGSPVLSYKAWSADKQPASASQQSLEWRLPLAELQRALEQHLQDKDKPSNLHCSNQPVWAGCKVELILQCSAIHEVPASLSAAPAAPTRIGLFVRPLELPVGALCRLRFSMAAEAAADARAPQAFVHVQGPLTRGFKPDGTFFGWTDALGLGSLSGWQQAATALRSKRLVHPSSAGAPEGLRLRLELHSVY